MKIDNYQDFMNQNTFYVFDFDDTLVNSPSFEELAIDFLKEDLSIQDLLQSSIDKIGVSLKDLNWQDERIFVKDPNNNIKVSGNWVRKGERVYLTSPDIYCRLEVSLPKTTKKLSEFYNKIENKCIVTARPESTRTQIENRMKNLGLQKPKWGLHMAPDNIKGAGTWKGHKIVELVNHTGFDKVIFYDDNSKYIKNATKVVKEKLPNLNFTAIKLDKKNL